jgi:predicted enzyme related to lactoylglutathione lyase
MFFGVSHIDLPVRDLSRSRVLYEQVFGFTAKREGEGFVDLEGGGVLVRLVESRRPESRATLRVQVADVEAAARKLAGAGARLVYEPARTPELTRAATLVDADGHTLVVWRELSEDEYGFMPELPKQLTWQPESEALLKSLLAEVPALFRAMARPKVVRNAEHLARDTRMVTCDHVVRAYILSNAKLTRNRVREPLRKHGYDPDTYREEFEA